MRKLLPIVLPFVIALISFHQAKGQVLVSGNVYEQDSITPIVGASVLFSGVDAAGDTVVYQCVTDTLGHYEDSVGYGMFLVSACAEGYECTCLLDSLLIECDTLQFEYDTVVVVYDSLTGVYDSIFMVYDTLTGQYDTVYFNTETLITGLDFVLYEIFYPVRYVNAIPYNDDMVRVIWSLLYEDETKTTPQQRSFRYFEVFRRRTDEAPVLLASHLTDTVFMETNWSNWAVLLGCELLL